MISGFRKYLGTWFARVLFLILVAAFGLWGVGDVVRNFGSTNWLARVGDRTIQPADLDAAYRRELAQVMRQTQNQDPSPEMKRGVAAQALERLITQAAIAQEARKLGIAVPETALRQAIMDVPAFRGPSGQFDRNTFEMALRNNGLTEARLLDLLRADLAQRQLLEPLRASAATPSRLLDQVFQAEHEKRVVELLTVPFADAPAPPAPDDAALHRWYDNHPFQYSTPEYRRIKAVLLTPESVGRDVQVSDADLHAAYDQHRAEYQVAEKRSAQVIATPDEARARALAAAWRADPDWDRIQAAASKDGASAVELADAAPDEFPTPELARAVFAAKQDEVLDPVRTPGGWDVVRITKITPGTSRSFEEAEPELRRRVVADKASDLMYERANKVEDALASGAGLTELPDNLGLVAVTGTLDATGNTQSGQPAPIPGPPELRAAVVEAAFKANKGEPPRLTEVQTPSSGGHAYYALSVDDVTKPTVKPYDAVAEQVAEDWRNDQTRRWADREATKILAAVQGGQSMEDAATVAGRTLIRTAPIARGDAAPDLPAALRGPVFAMKPHDPTMAETPDGFVVADVADIQPADPKSDPIAMQQLRDRLDRAMGDDMEVIFATSLRNRARPEVNQKLFDQVVQN
jgi:peptidyl-prolyl cis-trans isomerase D